MWLRAVGAAVVGALVGALPALVLDVPVGDSPWVTVFLGAGAGAGVGFAIGVGVALSRRPSGRGR